jgi:hypothetical protein
VRRRFYRLGIDLPGVRPVFGSIWLAKVPTTPRHGLSIEIAFDPHDSAVSDV